MYLIKNGTIYTMGDAGVVTGDVLVDNGKIVKIGINIQADGAEIIDAEGKCVVPGFVDAHSHIGGLSSMMDMDLNELTDPLTPQLNAMYSIKPDYRQFMDAARTGITTNCVIPGSGNVVGGLGIVIKSAGGSAKERIIKSPAVLKAALGINPKGVYGPKFRMPMSRMGIAFLLDDYFRRVSEYAAKKEAAGGDMDKLPPYDEGLENGLLVLTRKIPLKVHCYQHDMMTVLEIAKKYDILVTMDHAQGASDFYEELSDEHVKGVIFGPSCAGLMPGEMDKMDPECCKGLDDRGILVAVMTDAPATRSSMLYNEMGEAVRWGMDPVRALAMVTINPAKILDCEDRIGSLEEGKDADILIFDGMPALETKAVLEMVMINGKIIMK